MTGRQGPGIAQHVGQVAAAVLGYYACAFVGNLLVLAPSGFAILWPATAFLTAVMLVAPLRTWWMFALTLVPAHLHLVLVLAQPPIPTVVAFTQIGGNLALAAVTALACRWAARGPPAFDSVRGMLVFMVVAGVLAPAAVNAATLSAHLLTGWTQDFWRAWGQWMLASIFPAITVTPLVVLALRRQVLAGPARGRPLEPLLACLALFAISFAVFGVGAQEAYWPALLLAPLPLLLGAAVRWGVGGTALALLVFAGAILVRAIGGEGPFASHSPATTVHALQAYLTAVSTPLLLVAALMQERGRAAELLRRAEARAEIAAASTDTGLWQWDAASRELWMTGHCAAMFGLTPGPGLTPHAFVGAVHEEDRARVVAALDSALHATDVDTLGAFRFSREGETRWCVLRTHAERDGEGRLVRVSGVFRDISAFIAVQRQAELLSRRLRTLQDDERRAIAEELHDSTGQHLTAAGLLTQALERRLQPNAETRSLLADIQQSLNAAAAELRTFTFLLRPPELERQGLRAALKRYVEGFGWRTGLKASLRATERADELTLDQQRAVLRIAQEGLANVHRHANATRVTVRLRREGQDLHLLLADDGRGMPLEPGWRAGEPPRLGVGIPGMMARVRELGGRFAIRSRAGGTTIHVSLPLAAGARPARRSRSPARVV